MSYRDSNAALSAPTRVLAAELVGTGVVANAYCMPVLVPHGRPPSVY